MIFEMKTNKTFNNSLFKYLPYWKNSKTFVGCPLDREKMEFT